MSIPFIFPPSREIYETSDSIEDIKRKLNQQEGLNLWKGLYRFEKRARGKYIYANCKYCKASMRFKWSNLLETYQLRIFNTKHLHLDEKNINNDLERFINDLPFSVQLSTARKIAVNKFSITSSKFYHTYNKLKKTKSTLHQLIEELERKDYNISIDPFPLSQGQFPNIIIVISPEMKKMFQLYGQVVCYDLTYNIVQELSSNSRQYAVGIFTGVNCYNRIIPFETSEAFTKIFQTFIQCNGSPKTFITDQQISMKSALRNLQEHQLFKGIHLIDSFHVLRNFNKMSQRKDLLKQLSQIIREHSHVQYQHRLQNFRKKLSLQNELKAFQLFVNKSREVCFSQLPRGSFVIFNSSNSINEKMNDLIKSRLRSQKPYSLTLKNLVQFAQQLIQSSQQSVQLYDYKIEDIFQDSSLRLCRYLLAKRPMQQLLRQYVLSLSLRQPLRYGDIYVFKQSNQTFELEQANQQFECSCGYQEKTGICCSHILSICRQQRIDYLKNIHKRWKFDQKPVVKICHRLRRATRKRK